MRRLLVRSGIFVSAVLLKAAMGAAPASAVAPRVALCTTDHSSSPAFDADVQSKLMGTGLFSAVDLIDCHATTPTLAQLENYAAVFAYADYSYADPVALGNMLADYVDHGGRVVSSFNQVPDFPSNQLAGRLVTGGYLPYTNAGHELDTTEMTLVADLPGSALLAGVSAFDGGSSSFHMQFSLASGATLVAHWTDGNPLLAYKGNVVGLNIAPPSNQVPGRPDFWLRSTNGARLMANALLAPFAAQAQHIGYCAVAGDTDPNTGAALQPGTFVNLVAGQPLIDSHYTGATPANYLQGLGIACFVPAGYTPTGQFVGYLGAGESGAYPYYAKTSG